MKLYQRYYLITVTDNSGRIIREQMEYSGYSVSEEILMLTKEYPDHEVSAEFVQKEVQ